MIFGDVMLVALLGLVPVAITDNTGVALNALTEAYTERELAGAGPVTVAWSIAGTTSAFVPYLPNEYAECAGASRCIIVSHQWWDTGGGWGHNQDVQRILMAHEFAHVLSLERTETGDIAYVLAVQRVNEECLADAVTTLVLARGGFPPSVTADWNIAYQCVAWWHDTFGEDRSAEAAALAQSLLNWAVHRYDMTVSTPATAYAPAVRVGPQSVRSARS